MKTNYGGCDAYTNGNHTYVDDFEYKILGPTGNWLCPIAETDGYLIFNQKPDVYIFSLYREETYGCSGPCGEFQSVGILVNSINTCQNYTGYGYGYNLPAIPTLQMISNQVIAAPPADNSFCDKINLVAAGCSGTQSFYWEYSTDGRNFTSTNARTGFNQNYEFVKANFPLLKNYTGNISFRAVIDSDPTTTIENVFSNVVNYNVTACSPLLNGEPIPIAVKCADEANGSIIVNMLSTITSSQQLLLNLFDAGGFKFSKFISESEIKNNQFTWSGIAAGTYIIKYQAQSKTDNTDRVGAMPVESKPFIILNKTPLKFSLKAINPLCNTENGAVQITVSGGTEPYYYLLDNEPIEKKHEFISSNIIENAGEGNHTVKVIDSNECVEKAI